MSNAPARLSARSLSRRPRGFVLVFVLSALALIALIAGRFAWRVDALRSQALTMSTHAQAHLKASNAAAAALYWISTNSVGPGGFGAAIQPSLRADNRPYVLDLGGELRVQDSRGLYPLNAPERETFTRLMATFGIDAVTSDSFLDVLLDYQDTDSLKRLNGAEASEYAEQHLPPPSNDWLVSVRELQRMPLWRERPKLLSGFDRLGSTHRGAVFNPNSASRQLLEVLFPQARPEQLDLFETLRAAAPFQTADAAERATGIAFAQERMVFYGGELYRITTWAAGLPQALQYNVQLLPGGGQAPWLINEVRPAAPFASSSKPDRATAFPLAIKPTQP